ncbi:ULK/ULK protein Kinase [Phytophthora cinnamomi]|uniref:ULK/ULK protein Kinase n=1 Tax=Phytophthora cinnamomi TaxID=4785 RepID=UPI0035594E0C|nr:ULK/ULK protein Kinase [Phytophthora cinnamomi]
MENYNIYDEIGRGTHSFVYKARRKRSIEYVAVKSTAKSRMDKILNEVPFLHKLDSRHVLKFFDWYESSNHIWLILEYCMGGDLLNLITQDKQLPESAVKSFGIELVAGLQYLHANSILYCDLKPANVLIDEFGSLKISDLHDAFLGVTRHPHDHLLQGCVLYELRTGRQPFTHTNFSELARMIQTETVALPVPGYEMSPVFCNLLARLLVKDPYQRITWNELVDHPFWADLPHLEKVVMPAQDIFDAAAPTTYRYPNTSAESTDSVGCGDCSPDRKDNQHKDNEVNDAVATTLCAGAETKRKVHGRLEDLSPEEDDIDSDLSPREKTNVEDKVADLASRCLVFLSQIFGDQLNEAVFLSNKESVPPNESVSSLLLLCLQENDLNIDGVVMLRVLLTLKNCLRCEGNNAHVSHWMTDHSRVLKAVKVLASQGQNVRLENESDKSSGPSLGEQISRTSAAIVRLCRS